MTKDPKTVAYLDSSVVLRYAINHQSAFRGLAQYCKGAATSIITQIECLRVLDRWRITKEIDDARLVAGRSLCLKLLDGLRIMSIDDRIVALASQSFPIAIKSLDALHLAAAIQLQVQGAAKVAFLTHDKKLAMAACAVNLEVIEC